MSRLCNGLAGMIKRYWWVKAFEGGAHRFHHSLEGGQPDFPNLSRQGAHILPNTNYQITEIAQIRPYNTYRGVIKNIAPPISA